MTVANVNVTKVLLKRGNTVQNNNYTGVNGELTIDTQAATLRIHDGTTVGGTVLNASGVVGSYSNTNTAAYLASQSITSANIGGSQTFANANAAVQALAINSINANIGAYQIYANLILSNVGAGGDQQAAINSLNANVGAFQTYSNLELNSKADLTGALFTGNVTLPYLFLTNTLSVDEYIKVGPAHDIGVAFKNPAALFFGNTTLDPSDKFFQVNLRNLDASGSGDIVITADDGTDNSNYITVGLNGSAYSDPSFPIGPGNYPHDGFVYVNGGNLALQSDGGNIYLGANNGAYLSTNSIDSSWSIYGNINVSGNLVPGANVAYSLGDSTHQWRDLWVSNNTIYIGNTPIRVDGGTLLVNNNPVSGGAASSLVNGASTFQLFANGQSRSPDTIFAANGVSIINANGAIQGGIYNSGDADWFNIGASTGRGIKFYVDEETDGPQFTANGVVLPSTGVIKNITPGGGINLVSNNFAQLQWTTSTGVNEADPNQTNEPLNWLFVDNAGTWIETNKNGVVGDQQTWFFDLDGNTNVPGNVTTSGNVMTVGTANARMNFDTVNGISTMRVRQSYSRNIDNENTSVFMYGSVGGQGQIDIGWLANQALYYRGLLSRLTEKFQQGYTDFYHEYYDLQLEIYDANNVVTTANVTNIVSDYGNPPIFSITVDQVPPEEPYNLSSFNIVYNFDNVMGFDANLTNYGISVDNENIVLRTGRDITLDALDDFRVYAGSSFSMEYIRADDQGVEDGMLFRLTDEGSNNDTYFQFDGTIRTAANLRISPLSLYAPVPGTKIIQGADEILELISTGSFGNAQTTVGWSEAPNGLANIAAVGFNALVNGGVNITAGNLNFATASSWLFDKSGNLTLPNGTLIRDTGSVGTSGIGLGNHGFNIDFGSTVNDWAIMSGARLIQVQPDETFNIAFPEQANWQFANTGNLTFPDGTVQTTAYTGGGDGGNYGNANVQALLASNVSLIGSSSTITLATLGASATTTVSHEGGGAGYGVNTISGSASNSPGFALVQPGWTVTGNNLVGTTTVTSVTIDGFGTYTITTDTAVVDPFWYNDVYTFTSNTPSYSNLTVSSGNIINAGTYGQINFVANSSGDGYGLSTIQLVPYTAGYDSAIIIIDPTYPNHIHMRAGFEQDNAAANLFLGGEASHFNVEEGANPNVSIRSNYYTWTFNNTGVLTLPGEGVLQSLDDTVTLVSLNTTTGLANTVYLGSGGGVGFFDQAIGGNWLEIFRSGAEPEIRVPVGRGNLHVQTAEGVNVYNWTFDNTGSLTFPTGGNLTFDSSAVSVIDGVTDISATGTIGANVIQVLSHITSFGASPAPVISGFSSISTTGYAVNEGNISASGNLVASQNAYVTGNVFAARYNFANGVNILSTVGAGSYGNTEVAAYLPTYTGNIGAGNVNVTSTVYAANIVTSGTSGNISGVNVISANTFVFAANGVNILSAAGGGTYGNTEVAAYLLTWPNIDSNILDATSANITTLRANNFSTANAVISGGYISALTNASITTATITTLNSTGGNVTTLRVTNFSTANAVITGGYINSLANLTATTAVFTNFSTANAVISGGYISALTNASITTSVITNFSTANAVITGGYASGLANVTVTGNVTAGNLIGYGSNTTITAGTYTSTFDNVGMVTVPNLTVSGSVDATSITTDSLTINDTGWTNFTPTWYAGTGTNSVGDGLAEGRYRQLGKTVEVWMQITMGSTTTFGTGEYKVSLPVASRMLGSAVLSLVMSDTGTRLYNSLAHNAYTTTLFHTSSNVTLFWDTGVVTNTSPFTWTNGDFFVIAGTYEAS